MGPQDPKDVTRDTARDLSGLAGELAALKADAHHWLTSPEFAVLHLRLENAHAAVEAALIEARRRVRMNEERPGRKHPDTCTTIQPQIIAIATDAGRAVPGPSGRGYADFHAGVNFAITEVSEVEPPLSDFLGSSPRFAMLK